MLIKDLKKCKYSKVQDETLLCELLHPERELNNLKLDFSVAHAILKPGTSSKPHRLRRSKEIYFILEGEGMMCIEDEKKTVLPGQIVFIPPGAKQCIRNEGKIELKFLCVVSPPWRAENDHLCPE